MNQLIMFFGWITSVATSVLNAILAFPVFSLVAVLYIVVWFLGGRHDDI